MKFIADPSHACTLLTQGHRNVKHLPYYSTMLQYTAAPGMLSADAIPFAGLSGCVIYSPLDAERRPPKYINILGCRREDL